MGSVGAVEQTIWPVAGSNQKLEFGSAPMGGPGAAAICEQCSAGSLSHVGDPSTYNWIVLGSLLELAGDFYQKGRTGNHAVVARRPIFGRRRAKRVKEPWG